MNILIFAGRVSRQRWTTGGMVTFLCHELLARGHRLSLAVQSLDDTTPESPLAAASSIVCFDHYRQTATDFPFGFPAWTARRRRAIPHDVSLSLTRSAAADVYFPLDPTGASWLRRALDTRPITSSPHALALALLRHHGALRARARETLRRTPGPLFPRAAHPHTGDIRRILAVGPTAAAEAQRLLTPTGLADRVRQLPFFSTLTPPPLEQRADLRARTRAALAIALERRVILVSAPAPIGPTLDAPLRALAALNTRQHADPAAPLLLILARDSFAAHSAALRARADEHVRILGPTTRIDAALAASDLCALATPVAVGQFESGASGRLAADALRMGLPLLALSGASGYDLARHIFPDSSRPGLTLDTSAPDVWQRAFRTACEERWLSEASRAAARLGETLADEPFLGSLFAALNEAAIERTNPTL